MSRSTLGLILATLILLSGLPLAASTTDSSRVASGLVKLPLAFEALEQGRFVARGPGYLIQVSDRGATLALKPHSSPLPAHLGPPSLTPVVAPSPTLVSMALVGAQRPTDILPIDPLPGRSVYLHGGQVGRVAPHFAKVLLRNVYPGIDLVYYGNDSKLEYDFVVGPGADPAQIALTYSGIEQIGIDPSGALILHTANGDLVQHAPLVYQISDAGPAPIAGRYVVDNDRITFDLGAYDPDRPLVIDPVMSYSTFVSGSSWDEALGVAVAQDGSVYVTGDTYSVDFPLNGEAMDDPVDGNYDAYVAVLAADGSALLCSTYLGGSGEEIAFGIKVASDNSVIVTGLTSSPDFPVSADAFDATCGSDGLCNGGFYDAFVTRLTVSNGIMSIAYSTFLGGAGSDRANAVALDSNNNVYVTGITGSPDFPILNAFQAAYNGGVTDAFVTKLALGGQLLYSTFVGGNGGEFPYGIAVDSLGQAHITGCLTSTNFPTARPFQPSFNGGLYDGFLVKLNPGGNALKFSTYLGGADNDYPRAIALTPNATVNLGGSTWSNNFPLRNAFQPALNGPSDAFLARFDSSGRLLASSYLGGSDNEGVMSIALDSSLRIVAAGWVVSFDFPILDAIQASHNGGFVDGFVTKISNGVVSFSSYLGGSSSDAVFAIALDANNTIVLTGFSMSTDFPTLNSLFSSDGGAGDTFISAITGVN